MGWLDKITGKDEPVIRKIATIDETQPEERGEAFDEFRERTNPQGRPVVGKRKDLRPKDPDQVQAMHKTYMDWVSAGMGNNVSGPTVYEESLPERKMTWIPGEEPPWVHGQMTEAEQLMLLKQQMEEDRKRGLLKTQ